MQARQSDQIAVVAVSVIPLFSGASGIPAAVFLSSAVLFAVLIFELLFSLVKPFWLRSLRPLLALVLLASILKGIFLVCEPLLLEKTDELIPIFPLTLVSAFLLAESALTFKSGSIGARARVWGGFLALLLIVGASRQWGGTFRMFLPGPFWVSGAALAIFFFLRRRVSS